MIPYLDVEENIEWFYRESDPSKKSNAYKIADRLIVKYNVTQYRDHLISEIAEEILNKTAYLYRGNCFGFISLVVNLYHTSGRGYYICSLQL